MNTIEAFEDWLQKQGYRASTVQDYGKALAALHRTGGGALKLLPVRTSGIRAFLRWEGRHAAQPLVSEAEGYDKRATEALKREVSRVGPRRAKQDKRKREARSIGDAPFAALADVTWHEDSPEAAALSVLYATGLRVGDILAVTSRAIEEGVASGYVRLTVKGGDERLLPWAGAPEEWARLRAYFRTADVTRRTVADLLTSKPNASTLPGSAAYQRLHNALKRLAEEAGITDRVHLHRLRRTVAVRALRTTRDLSAVQQMLGHRNMNTTARYVDEARPEALAGIQQGINPRRKPPT